MCAALLLGALASLAAAESYEKFPLLMPNVRPEKVGEAFLVFSMDGRVGKVS